MADDGQYEFKEVRAIRGMEARTIAKLERLGWVLDTQTPGTLRTDLTFRRPKPKTVGTYIQQFAAHSYAAFRRLEPTTQRRLMAASGGVILLVVTAGAAVGISGGGDVSESAASPGKAATSSGEHASEEPTQESEPSEPPEETYTYQGTPYGIVTVDKHVGPADLTRYWVHTSQFNYSTDAYKEMVKTIIADIAHKEGTPKLLVEVVTDKEVAEAEAASTYESFVERHGMDYAMNVIPKREKAAWAASYTGGFDPDAGEPSDAATAFEIVWRPYATSEIEKWRPESAG